MNSTQLPTFLKMMHEPVVQKATQLFRRALPNGGKGYNFFRTLGTASRLLTRDKVALDLALGELANISNPAERAINRSAIENLYYWLKENDGEFFEAPKAKVISLDGSLTLKIEPHFGWKQGKKRTIVLLWAYKEPILRTDIGRVGAHILATQLGKDTFSDCEFLVLDLSTATRHRHLPKSHDKNETIFQLELQNQASLMHGKFAA